MFLWPHDNIALASVLVKGGAAMKCRKTCAMPAAFPNAGNAFHVSTMADPQGDAVVRLAEDGWMEVRRDGAALCSSGAGASLGMLQGLGPYCTTTNTQ